MSRDVTVKKKRVEKYTVSGRSDSAPKLAGPARPITTCADIRHAYVDVRTDAPTGTVHAWPIVFTQVAMACMYFPSHHYDSNAPLLGHLIDAGATGRQTTNRRLHSDMHVYTWLATAMSTHMTHATEVDVLAMV